MPGQRSPGVSATRLRPAGMYLVGITGGIASGKSLVTAELRSLGAVVLDSDTVAREVVAPGTDGLTQVIEQFGEQFLDAEGGLDRERLARRVFGDPAARRQLEQILHPLITARIRDTLVHLAEKGLRLAFVDAPVLIEADLQDDVDELWVVSVPEAVQRRRLMKRDGLSSEQADRRIRSQLPLKDKAERADRVIVNAGSRSETKARVHRLYHELRAELGLERIDCC